ncbi:Thioredoxin [Cynara cardunculus var. scolymus]|uniref:Thioredoxin n=1 Tax=Cynara cardunculus var. scolymus TaxID=59895 RepID=A0A103Y4P8_CYNCS|nr:Thioredoxin [Cynara cardunculus var. scolymus]
MGSMLSTILGGEQPGNGDDSSSEESRVIQFHSSQRWQLHFNDSKQSPKLMVVDFSATWCGPCKMLEPFLRSLASKYEDVEFIKIDVDELKLPNINATGSMKLWITGMLNIIFGIN